MADEIFEHTFENGLRLVAQKSSSALSAAIGIFVRNGARDEEPNESGISHLIEHMLFKGTKKRSALDLTYAISNLGAQVNAFNSEEETAFYAAVLPEKLTDIENLLFEMMEPSFPEADFELEKKVVLEEIAQYQDRPQFCLFEKALKDYFGLHPSGNSILGTKRSVSAISHKQIQDFFKSHYGPSNIIVAATGNFDWERLLKETAKYGILKANGKPNRTLIRHNHNPIFREYFREDLHQSHIILMAPAPSLRDKERYAFGVLCSVIGDVSGSRLYFDVVEPGLAESATMEHDEREDSGCVALYSTTSLELANKVADKMRALLKNPLDFSEEEVERAKKKIRVRLVQGNEVPLGRLIGFGSDYLAFGVPISIQEHLDSFQAISKKDIAKALETFPLSEASEFRLTPSNGKNSPV